MANFVDWFRSGFLDVIYMFSCVWNRKNKWKKKISFHNIYRHMRYYCYVTIIYWFNMYETRQADIFLFSYQNMWHFIYLHICLLWKFWFCRENFFVFKIYIVFLPRDIMFLIDKINNLNCYACNESINRWQCHYYLKLYIVGDDNVIRNI